MRLIDNASLVAALDGLSNLESIGGLRVVKLNPLLPTEEAHTLDG